MKEDAWEKGWGGRPNRCPINSVAVSQGALLLLILEERRPAAFDARVVLRRFAARIETPTDEPPPPGDGDFTPKTCSMNYTYSAE